MNNLNVMQTGIFNRPTLGDVSEPIPFYKEHQFISNDLIQTDRYHVYKQYMRSNTIDLYDQLVRLTLQIPSASFAFHDIGRKSK